MSSQAHQRQAAEAMADRIIHCAVLTISDTRTEQTDEGGPLVARLAQQAGCKIIAKAIEKDEPGSIRSRLKAWLADRNIQVVLTTGGTGIARRDTTIEVVRSLLTHELEGFGELFRMLSFEQVQAAAMMSRAVGGLVAQDDASGGDTFIFAMPGSLNAIETAMTNLICPQLAHLVWERRR